MRKPDKFIIVDGILAQAADGNAHALVAVDVGPDLRPVILVKVFDELSRRQRQTGLLRKASVAFEGGDQLLFGRVLSELDEDGGRMAVEHRHAQALAGKLRASAFTICPPS